MDQALAISSRNPFKRIKQKEAVVTAGLGVMSIVLWVLLFFGPFSQLLTAPVTFVLVLMLTSIVGTLLRSALRAFGVVSAEWPTNLVLERFVGLIFAFITFILSEGTNFFLSTQPIQLEGLADIQRVGLGLSLLVLITVLFLESSWRRILGAGAFLNRWFLKPSYNFSVIRRALRQNYCCHKLSADMLRAFLHDLQVFVRRARQDSNLRPSDS
jgi:hypothetical protein